MRERAGSNANNSEEENRRLREEIERLRKRTKELEQENRRLDETIRKVTEEKNRLRDQLQQLLGTPMMLGASDKTAEAGGMPTSRVFYRRPVDTSEKKATGGQPGHQGHGRPKPTPNAPPVQLTLTHCPECQEKLGDPSDVLTRIITDIPPPRMLVHELQTYRYKCGHCGQRVQAEPPIPAHKQFGPNVAAWVAYHRMLGLSMEKALASLLETYGLEMSEASGYELETWVAGAFGPRYEELKSLVKEADVVNGDETKFRVGGANGWLWVFSTLLGTLYVVHPSRGQEAPKAVLTGYEGTLVTDAWDSYDAVGVEDRQLDVLHVNRWLERVEVQHGIEPRKLVKEQAVKFTRAGRPPREFIDFADGVRGRFREAILFVESEPSSKQRERAYRKYRRSMQRFLNKPWKDKDAVRIAKELRLRLDMLFTFVRIAGVPWHNNDAERAIRQGVLHRKISGGRRTWEGADRFQVLLSVFESCKKAGENFLALARGLLVGPSYAGPAFPSGGPQS